WVLASLSSNFYHAPNCLDVPSILPRVLSTYALSTGLLLLSEIIRAAIDGQIAGGTFLTQEIGFGLALMVAWRTAFAMYEEERVLVWGFGKRPTYYDDCGSSSSSDDDNDEASSNKDELFMEGKETKEMKRIERERIKRRKKIEKRR
ncbi:hypothetical protein TrRE_jg1392, partial [Triparma retinervis]